MRLLSGPADEDGADGVATPRPAEPSAPSRPAASAPRSGGEDAAASPAGDVVRVAVIDDEPSVRTIVRMLFERSERFELVVESADVEDAMARVREEQPDAILLDLLMPETGGIAALPHLRTAAPGAMVVILSALRGVDEATQAFELGAFAYLEKSVLGPGLLRELDLLHDLHTEWRAGTDVWSRPGAPSRIRR